MAEKPGLQIERTHLSWERTGISTLAVTGLLLFHTDNPLAAGRSALAMISIILALNVFGIARSRGRMTTSTTPGGLAVVRSPVLAVALTGWLIGGLAAAILTAIALGM